MKKKTIALFSVGFLVIFTGLIFYMFACVSEIQKNAHAINYAGLIRGASQRLVKHELISSKKDDIILRIDEVLAGFEGLDNQFQLTGISSDDFNNCLKELNTSWHELKEVIALARVDNSKREEMFSKSELFFFLANDLVKTAENHAITLGERLKTIEYLIVSMLCIMLFILLIRLLLMFLANRRLSSMAYMDPLTGIANKRQCEKLLNEEKILAKGAKVACFMFDLNNLKVVNDNFGHKCGDILITNFASFLVKIAPKEMFVGRYGGDEFIGILQGEKKDILAFVEKIEKERDNLFIQAGNKELKIDFAFGYAYSEDHTSCSKKLLMDIADQNMYEQKMQMKAKN